jgi:nitrogen permease regulator 3-like protein
MPLLGILFVSYSSRGHQLVFSYPEITNDTFLGFESSFLADILSPKTQLCDKKFHLRVEQVDFVGHPTLLNVDRPGTGLIYSRKVQKSILKATRLSPLTMFHLVFAMGETTVEEIDLIYEHCLLKVTNAFKFEQLRRGYIREQTELILQLRDQQQQLLRESTQNRELTGAGRILDISQSSQMIPEETNLIEQTPLAKTIIQVFQAFHSHLRQNVITINNSVSFSIQTDLSKLIALTEPIVPGTFKTTYPAPRPYHSLLLLQDPEETMLSLPLNASPFLIRMIQTTTPTTSFEQLQTALNCSLSQIYRFAAHLHFWGKAKIIQTISSRSFYVVSDNSDLAVMGRVSSEFNTRFSPLELEKVLQDVSIPKPYHNIIPTKELKNLYLESIAFLLRHELVVQVHMYLGNLI